MFSLNIPLPGVTLTILNQPLRNTYSFLDIVIGNTGGGIALTSNNLSNSSIRFR
jgi:hypothetical protein